MPPSLSLSLAPRARNLFEEAAYAQVMRIEEHVVCSSRNSEREKAREREREEERAHVACSWSG